MGPFTPRFWRPSASPRRTSQPGRPGTGSTTRSANALPPWHRTRHAEFAQGITNSNRLMCSLLRRTQGCMTEADVASTGACLLARPPRARPLPRASPRASARVGGRRRSARQGHLEEGLMARLRQRQFQRQLRRRRRAPRGRFGTRLYVSLHVVCTCPLYVGRLGQASTNATREHI